jgi:hypothetical protein
MTRFFRPDILGSLRQLCVPGLPVTNRPFGARDG